jgi:hypothetical protein
MAKDLETYMVAPILRDRLFRVPLAALNRDYQPMGELAAEDIGKIVEALGIMGFLNPVRIDEMGGIVAGHGRVTAAKQLGIEKVPTIELSHLMPAERRAYVIADNRLAELAGWDREILRIEFQALAELDLDFDLEITGFETAELDLLLDDSASENMSDPADEMPDPELGPAVTQPGDIWILSKHKLICSDARNPAIYTAPMGAERARAVFTDPPYNVKIDGHVCGSGTVKHREFAMASGEMNAAAFTTFLEESLGAMATMSLDGAIHFTCMDWRHMAELQAAGDKVYSELQRRILDEASAVETKRFDPEKKGSCSKVCGEWVPK